MTRLRIVHLTARLPVGGMEKVVMHLVEGLPSARFQSEIWCLEELDVLGRQLQDRGLTLTTIGKRDGRDPKLFLRLAALIRATRPAVLHCHDELSWFYGTIAARLVGLRRVVVTMHGRRRDIGGRHLFEQRALARLSARVVSVSEFLKRQLLEDLRLPPERVQTIVNGIPLEPFRVSPSSRENARRELGIPEDAFVVGSVGELSEVKNFDLALAAIALARQTMPGLRFVLIGAGALRDALANKAAALDLSSHVDFAGLRHNVPALLPSFDTYLCSSHYEGISLSILEAMAAGRAVVATHVGGNSELIEDGGTGLLVPPSDPPAMAAAIVRLAREPVFRSSLGARAATRVQERYGLDKMTAAYDELYARLNATSPLHRPAAEASSMTR